MVALAVVGALVGPVSVAAAAADPAYPKPAGWVTDTAHVLTPAAVQRLDAELGSFAVRTSDQIAVAVVPSLDGQSIEAYAYTLFNRWGVGQRGRNNGVLLLVSSGDRRIRVEVGSGLTGQLPDSRAQQAVTVMSADLHHGDYQDGLTAGERDIRRDLGDSTVTVADSTLPAAFGGGQTAQPAASGDSGALAWGLGVLGLFLLSGVFAWRAMRGWTRSPDAVPFGQQGWWYGGTATGSGYSGSTGGGGFGGGSTGGGGASGGF